MYEVKRRNSHKGRQTRVLSETPNVALALLLALAVTNDPSVAQSVDGQIEVPPASSTSKIVTSPTAEVAPSIQSVAAVDDLAVDMDQPVADAVPAAQNERGDGAPVLDVASVTANSSSDLHASNSVQMSAVSRVTLRLLGFNDLNGGYAINAGTISIPGVGRFDVSGQTIGEFESALTVRLSEVFRRDIAASVEVERYAPYFVTGQVASPGEIEWRPGLTLIQAIALAGGEQRDRAGGGADNLLTVQQARMQVMYGVAELERLKAEKDELNGFAISSRHKSVQTSGSPQLDALAQHQDVILQERRTMMQTQLDGLRREHESALTQLSSAQTQAAAVEKQLELARSVMQGVSQLHAKKLVANSRYMEQQRDVATVELQLAEMRGFVETARARVAATERQMTVLQQQRIAVINERIEVLHREIAVNESTIASFSSTPATEPPAPPAMEYNIARQKDGRIETIPAHVFSEVQPGDVIIVSPRPADPQRSANVDRSRFAAVSDPMRETIVRTELLMGASAPNRLPLASRFQRTAGRPIERR